jgi:hypothetical protein
VSIGSSAAVFLSSLVGGTSPTEPVNLRPILTQLGREASVHLRAQLSRPCTGKKKNHSLPGEYPKSETGNLRSSVGFKVSGKDTCVNIKVYQDSLIDDKDSTLKMKKIYE